MPDFERMRCHPITLGGCETGNFISISAINAERKITVSAYRVRRTIDTIPNPRSSSIDGLLWLRCMAHGMRDAPILDFEQRNVTIKLLGSAATLTRDRCCRWCSCSALSIDSCAAYALNAIQYNCIFIRPLLLYFGRWIREFGNRTRWSHMQTMVSKIDGSVGGQIRCKMCKWYMFGRKERITVTEITELQRVRCSRCESVFRIGFYSRRRR